MIRYVILCKKVELLSEILCLNLHFYFDGSHEKLCKYAIITV